jgi:hypothetical protein
MTVESSMRGKLSQRGQGSVVVVDVLSGAAEDDLHQRATWIPQGPVRWFAWASILVGWLLATAVVAAITGVVKRD